MVLNDETIELINYSKDLDIDYNIKLYLIIFFIILSIFLIWYSNKIERNTDINNLLFYLSRYISIIIIVFIPLYFFLLLRSVDSNLLLVITIGFYTIVLIGSSLIFLWFAVEYFLFKSFGIKFNNNKVKTYREESEYRRIT